MQQNVGSWATALFLRVCLFRWVPSLVLRRCGHRHIRRGHRHISARDYFPGGARISLSAQRRRLLRLAYDAPALDPLKGFSC